MNYYLHHTPWRERIHLFQGEVQAFTPTYKYDIIICNPPFFINSTKNPELNRTLARHLTKHYHTKDILKLATIYYYREVNFVSYYKAADNIKEWIGAEQMEEIYGMSKDARCSFVHRHKIPSV